MTSGFERVAPYLQDPLVLAGFAVFLFFSFCRYLITKGIVPQLNQAHGFRIVRAILLYGFLIGLAIILLGFGLKYRSLSRAEQERAVSLLRTELDVNSETVSEISANLETLVGVYDSVARALRSPGIPVLHTLFPEANLRQSFDGPTPQEVAEQAIASIAAAGLDRNQSELARADAAGKAIAATIKRTRLTVSSLGDATHRRYAFRDEAYRTQLPLLHRIDVVDITDIQAEYADLARVRNTYDVVVVHLGEYLDTVDAFFSPSDNEVTVSSLTRVLTAERMAVSTLMTFTPDLVAAGTRLRTQRDRIRSSAVARYVAQ